MEKTIRVFMDKTDWDHEVGYASDGNKVYPSERTVLRERACASECGIVEVEMRFVRVVRPENMDLMLEKAKA